MRRNCRFLFTVFRQVFVDCKIFFFCSIAKLQGCICVFLQCFSLIIAWQNCVHVFEWFEGRSKGTCPTWAPTGIILEGRQIQVDWQKSFRHTQNTNEKFAIFLTFSRKFRVNIVHTSAEGASENFKDILHGIIFKFQGTTAPGCPTASSGCLYCPGQLNF